VQHMITLAIHDSIRHKVHINIMETLFVFYETIGVQQEINIVYLQFVNFNHFILVHSKLSQFHIHVKINSQEYTNPIPRAFEPMIIHQVSIP